jgi:hypothetical protein
MRVRSLARICLTFSKQPRADFAPVMAPSASSEGFATITTPPGTVSAPGGPSPPKKRGGGPKAAGQHRAPRKRAPKQVLYFYSNTSLFMHFTFRTTNAVPPHLRDDAGSISESMSLFMTPDFVPYIQESAAYPGTAASSPPHDEPSPEFIDISLPSQPIPIAPVPSAEDFNLEGVALPTYPLPTKPFPVHPPPKIGSGFAQALPLDKSGKKVRHWRQANREIRGIAGGRWFAKAWIGDKESEYAAAHAAAPPPIPAATQATALAMIGDRDSMPSFTTTPLPRPSATSSGRGRGRGAAFTTNSSSRAQSTGADSVSAHIPKKRTTTQPSSSVNTPVSGTAPAPS